MRIVDTLLIGLIKGLYAASVILLIWFILSWAEIAFNTEKNPTYSKYNAFAMMDCE